MRLIHFKSFLLLFFISSIHWCIGQRVEWITSGTGSSDGSANNYFCNLYSIAQHNGVIYAPGLVLGNTGYFGNTVISGGSLTDSYFNFLARYDTAGHVLGVQEMTGVGASYTAVDNMGNVYVTGGPNAITKVDSEGAVLWKKELEKTSKNYFHILTIATDHSNNLIIAGDYRSIDGSVVLEDSVLNIHPLDGTHFFIIKYNSDGKLKWFRSSYSSNGIVTSKIRNICVSETDDIYYIGDFQNNPGASIIVGDTTVSAKVLKLTPQAFGIPYQDIILGKLSGDGDFKWVHTMGGQQHDWGNSIKVTPDNEVYFTGTFRDSVEVDGKYYHGRIDEILLGKISANNSLQWLKTKGENVNDAGRVIYLTDDAIYLGGELSSNAILAKYNRAGDEQWVLKSQGTFRAGIYDLVSVGNKLLFGGYAMWTKNTTATFGDMLVPAVGTGPNNLIFILGSINLDVAPMDPTVAILEKNTEDILHIFPNPSEGIFNLRMEDETTEEIQVTVIDGIGKSVTSFVLGKSENDYYQLDLANLPNGIYSMIVRDNRNQKIEVLKLMKK